MQVKLFLGKKMLPSTRCFRVSGRHNLRTRVLSKTGQGEHYAVVCIQLSSSLTETVAIPELISDMA